MSETTYVATSEICLFDSVPLNAGIPPPPFVTWPTTVWRFFADGLDVRSGPPLPPPPARRLLLPRGDGDPARPAVAPVTGRTVAWHAVVGEDLLACARVACGA